MDCATDTTTAAHMDAPLDRVDPDAVDTATWAALRSPFLITLCDRFLFKCTGLAALEDLLADAETEDKPVVAYLEFNATANLLYLCGVTIPYHGAPAFAETGAPADCAGG